MKNLILLFLITCFTNLYAQKDIFSANHKDCKTAYLLPNLKTLMVTKSNGEGLDLNEVPSPNCLESGSTSVSVLEFNSFWFKMTCVQSGSLAFTITPKDLTDDLDFVVFDAPKDDCAQKSIIRCVASGMGGGNTNACLGAVGLNFTSTDLSESAGCGGGNDSFVKALDMEKGKTYFVLVNVFNGGINSFYTITFDGTANIATTTETNNLENQDISVYPSIHAQPSFEVGLGQKNISNATLEVFDLAGKSMLQTVLTSEHNHIELPESTKPGLYLIRITQNRQVFYKKFVFAK